MTQLPPKRRALFPISLGNALFSTRSVRRAVLGLPEKTFDEYVFLVADQLQYYNKARRIDSSHSVSEVLNAYRLNSHERDDRQRWLKRLERSLGTEREAVAWRVVDSAEFADERFVFILRSLLIAQATVPLFAHDIHETAARFLASRFSEAPEHWVRLSELYLVEELALSIRVRVCEGIEAEFYMGQYPSPLLDLYRGKYGLDVEALAGVSADQLSYSFFRFENSDGVESARWTLCQRDD